MEKSNEINSIQFILRIVSCRVVFECLDSQPDLFLSLKGPHEGAVTDLPFVYWM